MAEDVPASLKHADLTISKCATRASQLQTVDPVMAYWCEYWVVNQILARGLHQTDSEVMQYTTHLVDKLEQTKQEYASNDAVVDDVAGQAYVENFAQKTLDRAERVVKANKVTKQTADTFDAAATFFHLVNIWGTADQETQQKIKYAKWNALRIVKAIKEGKDPNESNPKLEEEALDAPPPLDPNDPEVQRLAVPDAQTPGPRPASVEDVPDGGSEVKRDAQGVSLPPSPSSAMVGVSPLPHDIQLPSAPSSQTVGADRQTPASQLGYFDNHQSLPSPLVPPPQSNAAFRPQDHTSPQPPATWTPTPPPQASSSAFLPSAPGSVPGPSAPTYGHHQPAVPPSIAPPTFASAPSPTPAVASPPPVSPQPPTPNYLGINPAVPAARPPVPPVAGPPPVSYGIPAVAAVPPPQASRAAPTVPVNTVVDDMAMAQAQKHARWAISALNFEDVNTAVRELRNALRSLGAG